MTLNAYLRILRERWKVVFVFVLISLAIAVAVTASAQKKYQSTAQVFVASASGVDPLNAAQGVLLVQEQVATYASIVSSPDVLHAVESDLHLSLTDAELKAKISASAPASKTLIDVSVTDNSPASAAAIANSVAKAFCTVVEGYATPDGAKTSSVRLIVTSPATASSSPVSPRPTLNIALALIVGGLLGVGLALFRDSLDNRVKDAEAFGKLASSAIMGVVVEDPKTARHPIATRAGNRNIRAENYRQLRANLQFANVDRHPRVIAVTSSVPTEGKTTVAVNLASTLAEAGFSVCLVDADLRRPTVAKVLGLLSPVGLTSVLIHQIELNEVLQMAGSGLFVLTSGPTPPNPSEVLASSYLRDVIRSLLDKVDYVILDTAPLLPVADGSEVAALADGTLLVGRHGLTTENNVKRAVGALARVDATLLGVVLNRMPRKNNRDDYGYTYYRESEAATHAQGGKRRDRRRASRD